MDEGLSDDVIDVASRTGGVSSFYGSGFSLANK